jgi:hypothetical protein
MMQVKIIPGNMGMVESPVSREQSKYMKYNKLILYARIQNRLVLSHSKIDIRGSEDWMPPETGFISSVPGLILPG